MTLRATYDNGNARRSPMQPVYALLDGNEMPEGRDCRESRPRPLVETLHSGKNALNLFRKTRLVYFKRVHMRDRFRTIMRVRVEIES